jgi:hypothetical protein
MCSCADALSWRTIAYWRNDQPEKQLMRSLLLGLILTTGLVCANSAFAGNWTIAPPGTERSKEIKSMDILERPNRVLHFYGDTVRLSNRRRSNAGRTKA